MCPFLRRSTTVPRSKMLPATYISAWLKSPNLNFFGAFDAQNNLNFWKLVFSEIANSFMNISYFSLVYTHVLVELTAGK